MLPRNVLIFPGLDGTDRLLQPFREAAPECASVNVLTLPDNPAADFSGLVRHFDHLFDDRTDCMIIGESFSGPLSVMLAKRHSRVVKHLVIVASFLTSPLPWFEPFVPWRFLFRLPIPSLAASWLIGIHQGLIPELKEAVRDQSAVTLARRIELISRIDVENEFRELTCPVTYLLPTQDRLVSSRHAGRMKELKPDMRICELEGPHLILQTRPAASWKKIMETLVDSE